VPDRNIRGIKPVRATQPNAARNPTPRAPTTGTCAESSRGEGGSCGCRSRRLARGVVHERGRGEDRADDLRCRTTRGRRSIPATRSRSRSEQRPDFRRSDLRGCSARSGAPSGGRRWRGSASSTFPSSRTTDTSSSRATKRAAPVAGCTDLPSGWRSPSTASTAARGRSSAIGTTPVRSRRRGRCARAWSTCCSTSGSISGRLPASTPAARGLIFRGGTATPDLIPRMLHSRRALGARWPRLHRPLGWRRSAGGALAAP
jgi:hypothetical protein